VLDIDGKPKFDYLSALYSLNTLHQFTISKKT
jgi:hypothetical protein